MAKLNRIILVRGQSFPAGQGNTNHLLPSKYKSKYLHNARVWQTGGFQVLNSDLDNCSFPIANNNRNSCVYFFTDLATSLDADVYIIPICWGAKGLAIDAGAEDFNVASVNELHQDTLDAIQSAKDWMDARGKSYIFEAEFWSQGQEDAIYGSKSSAYYTNLVDMYAAIITATGNANLTIIQNYIEDCPNTTYGSKATVNTAKTNFTALDPTNRKCNQLNWTTYYDGTHPVTSEYLREVTDYVFPQILNNL